MLGSECGDDNFFGFEDEDGRKRM